MVHSSTALFLMVGKTPGESREELTSVCLGMMHRFQGLLLANIHFHFNIVAAIAVLRTDTGCQGGRKGRGNEEQNTERVLGFGIKQAAALLISAEEALAQHRAGSNALAYQRMNPKSFPNCCCCFCTRSS